LSYKSRWQTLADGLSHVIASGLPGGEAKTQLAHAIADRSVAVRVLIDESDRDLGGKSIVGKLVHVPDRLRPEDFDWGKSRPRKPWEIDPKADHFGLDLFPTARRIALVEVASQDVDKIWSTTRPLQDLERGSMPHAPAISNSRDPDQGQTSIATPVSVGASPNQQRPPSLAELRRWYTNRVEQWPSSEKPPSSDQDWQDAKEAFKGLRVTRESIRDVLGSGAPHEWTAQGRRKLARE
jgi:hypothetical protein